MYENNPLNSTIVTDSSGKTKMISREHILTYAFPESEYCASFSHRIESLHSIFIKEFPSGYRFDGEKHNCWEMVYVADGGVSVTEEDSIYNMNKGDIIFHRPNEFHSFNVSQDSNCTIMVICFSINSNLIGELGSSIYKLNNELHDMLFNCYNCIAEGFLIDFTYIRKKSINYNQITEALGILSFEKFILEVLSKAKKHEKLNNSVGAQNYMRIAEVLSEHIREKLTIEDIAKYCYMTTFNVKKTFAKYSGSSILKYFNSLKITRAKDLIKQGYSFDFISAHLGYSSPCYFSKAFKKETGISPRKYKQNL